MQISQMFSGKRQAIDKAKSTVVATMVIAAIIVSFSIVTLNFLWDLRGYNQRVIAEKEKARDVLLANVENAQELQQNFNLFEQGEVTSQDVLDALPSRYDFAALVTSIDSLAKRSGMLLESFSGDDESAEALASSTQPTPTDMSFRVSVQGGYEDLQEFLEVLDRSIRPMRVEAIELSGTDELMNADITLSTFYQPKASLEIETKVVQ